MYKGTATARASVWEAQACKQLHAGACPPLLGRSLDQRSVQNMLPQVKRRKADFDVLLTTYELIMAPADGQRLSQLKWNYIMCALIDHSDVTAKTSALHKRYSLETIEHSCIQVAVNVAWTKVTASRTVAAS